MAKSKPTLNLASLVSTNSSTVQGPIASKSLGIFREACQDAASSSQAVEEDAVLDESSRRLVASGNLDIKGKGNIWPRNFHIFTGCVPHMVKVFSIVRQRSLSSRDKMENLDVNEALWSTFMPVLLQVAVHFGTCNRNNFRLF